MALRIVLVLASMLGLCACAGTPHRAYDPLARQQVLRVGLLTPATPERPVVRMAVHPGQSLGLVGLLLAEGDMGLKTRDFGRVLEHQTCCAQALTARLREGLEGAGYTVSEVRVPRAAQPGFLARYPAHAEVDALLDVYAEVMGYTAAGAGTPYRPTLHLHVRLLRERDHHVLYQDRIDYNAFGDGGGAITLPADPRYAFADFDALLRQPAQAAAGLDLAMIAARDTLVRQLQ